MEKLTYERGLEIISETAKEYEKKRDSYRRKRDEKSDVEAKIEQIKSKIKELSSMVLSIDDIKKDSFAMAEKIYSDDIAEANRIFNEATDEIDNSEKRDPEVKLSIENEFNEKINSAYEKVNNIASEVNQNSQLMDEARAKCDDLEQQINNSSIEENQIKLYATHIASEFDNVVNNAEFISDYRDPRGATPEEAPSKFLSLSAKKIKKIACKMNSGAYVSSPDESKGLPIMEILIMAATTLWLVIKGVFHGIGFLYRPIYRFYKVAHKIAYTAIVTLILFLLLLFISTRFGDGITAVLFMVLIVVVAIFLGMILFNVIKYSNKAFRKEQNLDYYTVGYFFTFAKDEIMFKIASDYYAELKTKNLSELEKILQSTFGVLQSQKEDALRVLNTCEERLEVSRERMCLAEEQFNKEKSEFKQQCKVQIDVTINQLNEERVGKRKQEKIELDNRVTDSTNQKETAINNAEKNAIETLEKRKQDIANAEHELECEKEKQQIIASELDTIYNDVDNILMKNNEMATEYKKLEISVVQKRMENDKIPESLVAGLTRYVNANLRTGREEMVYKQVEINHRNKPIIITCDITDDESKIIAESYYSFIDSLIGDLLGKTYMGAFRFVLVDSQGNKSGIVKCMETCREAFEDLERFGCLKICTNRSDKCFEDVIKEQEEQLIGKNIDEVNEAKKNLDNMVRYNFLCIRIYSKKTGDFSLGDFRKRVDSSLNNGIIPIVIMSQSYFEEKRDDFEGTIKELCDNRYYKLDVNSNEGNKIKVINLVEDKIQ